MEKETDDMDTREEQVRLVQILTHNAPSLTYRQPIKPFRLLDLPSELQLVILDFSVAHAKPVELFRWLHRCCSSDYGGGDAYWSAAKPPALAHICRALKHDVLAAYYNQNTFRLSLCNSATMDGRMRQWFQRLPVEYRGLIRLFLVCWRRGQLQYFNSIEGLLRSGPYPWRFMDALERAGLEMVPDGKMGGKMLWRFAITETVERA